MPKAAWKAFERHTEPDAQLLLRILDEALHGFECIYVCIDALDESQSRENFLTLIEKLVVRLDDDAHSAFTEKALDPIFARKDVADLEQGSA